MTKRIWLGPVLGNTRERLISRCVDHLKAADLKTAHLRDLFAGHDHPAAAALADYGFLYLTASRPLLELVTQRLIQDSENKGLWGPIPVNLFRGFVGRVLNSAIDVEAGLPLPPRTPTDREEFPAKRSLISRILKRQTRNGQIKRIAALARHDGCMNSVSLLLGEIERAGLDAAALEATLAARSPGFQEEGTEGHGPAVSQLEIDREVLSIYRAYQAALDANDLTEEDADQLRALNALKGELDGRAVRVPWLEGLRLLILDGFFDFTPNQGEIIRLLVTRVPDVIVSFNWDESNRQVFRPFMETIERLCSMADFQVELCQDAQPASNALKHLRSRLFKSYDEFPAPKGRPRLAEPEQPSLFDAATLIEQTGRDLGWTIHGTGAALVETAQMPPGQITLFECDDRLTEIRTIAKEIKRLVILNGYELPDICVVARQLAVYSASVIRVFEEESIPHTLDKRIALADIPAARAAIKLLGILGRERGDQETEIPISALADIIKCGYFGLSAKEQEELGLRFAPDEIENVIAYVGGDLGVNEWLDRARYLAESLAQGKPGAPGTNLASDLVPLLDSAAPAAAPISLDQIVGPVDILKLIQPDQEPESIFPPESGMIDSRIRPSTKIEAQAIHRSRLVIKRIAQRIMAVPGSGSADSLSARIQLLFRLLRFPSQIERTMRRHRTAEEMEPGALDMRALEGIQRALIAAVEAINIVDADPAQEVTTADLVEEILRCMRSQTLRVGAGSDDGVRVLEATDMRGLRFRAIFVAGLVEGGFPLRPSRDWIYPQEQREQLKEYGLSLEDISAETLLKEEHYFYQVVCRATELLYLSRPLVSGDILAAATARSYYIEELKLAVAPIVINTEIFHRDYTGSRLLDSSTQSELSMYVARIAQSPPSIDPTQSVDRLLSWARENCCISADAIRRIEIGRQREGRSFGSFDGRIEDRRLAQLLQDYFGSDHVFSATGLSMYGKCPFRFFASRVLGMEPRSEAALDLKATDAGELLHEIMRVFMERHRGQLLAASRNPGGPEQGLLRTQLMRTADDVFDRYEAVAPPLNPHVWKIDREIRKLLLEQVLEYELTVQEKVRQSGLAPAFFELAFGMKREGDDPASTERMLEITRPGFHGDAAQTARLRGRIDRLDLAPDGTAVAYDYKLSKGASVADMRAGRDVQLAIYLSALEEVFFPQGTLAGGGYYAFKGGSDRRNNGLYRKTLSQYTGLSNQVRSNLTDSEWSALRTDIKERIWEFMDSMRAGEFVVKPSQGKQTCSLCDYGVVCRYDTYRIRRKVASED